MNLIKNYIEVTTKKASHTEMPEDIMYYDIPCILTARDIPWNKLEDTTPNKTIGIIASIKRHFVRTLTNFKQLFFR